MPAFFLIQIIFPVLFVCAVPVRYILRRVFKGAKLYWKIYSLIALIRDGNAEAFGQVIERYQSPIGAYLYRLTGEYENSP